MTLRVTLSLDLFHSRFMFLASSIGTDLGLVCLTLYQVCDGFIFSISPSVFTSDKLISNNLRWKSESMHGIQLIPFSGFLLRYQRINVISQEMYSSKWYHTILWSTFRRLPAQFPCVTFSIQFSLHYIIATRWIFPPIKLNNWILGSHQYGSTDCYEKGIEKGRTQKPIS